MTDHPCGALPVRGWNLSLFWCDHHQAYWAHVCAHVQIAEGVIQIPHQETMVFGPFDAFEDVERWLQGQWVQLRSGLPR